MPDDAARWRQLQSIVFAALARPADEREAFLAAACSDDSDLRREAAALLQQEGRAAAFLSGTPRAVLAAAGTMDVNPSAPRWDESALSAGQTLGHYRIINAIGSGGMGQVYLAQDSRLGRQVALKILPPELRDDSERRARFRREAKAIAALNHPNIVTVHAVDEVDGFHFITMELVVGRTLADLLPQSGFTLERFLAIAIPLTDALAAAHQQGITHRDVKPANVMVSDAGRVKVLDFGLAKVPREAQHNDGTRTDLTLTEVGQVAGTPAYMSPEQAEGKEVDARSDIFSLGIVFYEMLSGQRPFAGDSPTATLSSILRSTPRHLGELKPALPRRLALLVHRCLEKEPLERYQSLVDLRHDLEDVRRDSKLGHEVSLQPSESSSRRGMSIPAAVGGAIVVVGAASLWLAGTRWEAANESVLRLQNAVQVTASALAFESYPMWSPDGQRLVYQASDRGYQSDNNHDVWVVQLGSGEPVNLTATSTANDRRPSWSPNGQEIAFYSNRDGGWGVFAMSAIGGKPRKLLALPHSYNPTSHSAPQWSLDNSTLFVAANEDNRNFVIILSIASLSATRVMLPQHESPRCWDLSVRPDGGRLAYLEAGGGNPEVSRLWTIAASGGEATPLTDGRTRVWSPTWSTDGRTIYYVSNRAGTMDLWQQHLADDGKPLADASSITQGVGMRSASFSRDGTRLAYGKGGLVSNVWRVPILPDRAATWADATRLTSEHALIEFVDVSPDGHQLALSSDRRGNQDLWVLPAAGGEMTQLTRDPTPDWNPRWSPDGRDMLFYALRSGNRDIWVMPSSGGPARQLTSRTAIDWYAAWSPDGREIAYHVQGPPGEIWIMSATGAEQRLIAKGIQPTWSPDGQSLVFIEDGTLFRVAKEGGAPQRLNTPRTHVPVAVHFSPDGESIYYSINGGVLENHGIWRLSLQDGTSSRLTQFEGKPGTIGYYFSADSRFLYVTWFEPEGDIWVMDVAGAAAR